MDKVTVLKAIDTLQKLTAFMIGVNKDLNFKAFQLELKYRLDEVLKKADNPVDLLDKDLISHFKELHTLNNDLSKSIAKELNVYFEIRHRPDLLSDKKRARGKFYDEISTHLFMFDRNLEATPWGDLIINEHLSDQYISYLSNQNLQKEIVEEKEAIFSCKSYWPDKPDAFEIWARIILLEEKGVVKSPFSLFNSRFDAYSAIAHYYELKYQTIRNAYKSAKDEINSSSIDKSPYRQRQMKRVKEWLHREGYEEIAKLIVE